LRIVDKIADLPHQRGERVGFVPTMGAFHQGHLRLMRQAKSENDLCIVSLFVNPTQFGKNEDFDKYPRDLGRDALLAEEAGVDLLFAPSVAEVYPRIGTSIHVPGLTERWEGAVRPGHFDGVATVVCKLFNIVRPTVSYFGLKDLQQCMVIRQMCSDLNLPYKVSLEPTVREPDGLAMSSRNVYLDPNQRAIAPKIYEELLRSRRAIQEGSTPRSVLDESRSNLESIGFTVDYFALVELPNMESAEILGVNQAIIAAAKLGTTRLIDNILL
jgi:pantoate--beta-alanine ligase